MPRPRDDRPPASGVLPDTPPRAAAPPAGARRRPRVILDVAATEETGPASNALFVERFLEYARHERVLAANTLEAYGRDLRDFLAWLGGRNAAGLSVRDLGDYLGRLDGRGLSRASVARAAATLRVFYAFLQLEGTVGESPAELLVASRRDDTIPGTLSAEQVDRLLAAPNARTPSGQRDRALLELLYATGCRASEVAGMRLVDVHLRESFCTCRGKGDKERVVPLGARAVAAVRRLAPVGRSLIARQPAVPHADLGGGQGARPQGGGSSRHRSAHAAAQLRHPSRRRRRRPASRAGNARTREHRHHPALHSRRCRTPQGRPRQVPPARLTARRPRHCFFGGVNLIFRISSTTRPSSTRPETAVIALTTFTYLRP